MAYRWYEKQNDGTLKLLTLSGEYVDEFTGVKPLQVSQVGDITLPQIPWAPDLTVTQPTRTTSTVTWARAAGDPTPPITSWVVERRSSTDNGTNWSGWAAITGSPFAATTFIANETGLATGTPEVKFEYRAAGVNVDGQGPWSPSFGIQWTVTVVNPPTRPTNLVVVPGSINANGFTLQWAASTSAATDSGDKYAIFLGNATTPTIDNINPNATTYVWTGLPTGVQVSNINVKRHNSAGYSPGSNWINATPRAQIAFAPYMGVSNSDENHGGTNAWESWRVYSYAEAKPIANVTGAAHPKALALTDKNAEPTSPNSMYRSYQNAYDSFSAFLEDFYYGAGSAARADVEIHMANGNEYGADVTAGNLAGFIQGCRGLYEASRILNPNGTRRYPLASTWLDPTHFQEANTINGSGINVPLDQSIYPVVQYLDGIAWSLYPPGRESSVDDPTWEWPSFDGDLARDLTVGNQIRLQRCYLVRCWRRTYEAQFPVYNPYLTEFHPLKIACWEIGSGNDPDDQTTRPFWATHIVASFRRLCENYSLEMATAHWWDQQLTQNGVPQSDNPFSHEQTPTGTEISTRVAWQNWKQYSHWDGGTHPAAWAGNPKPTGTTAGTWKNRNQNWLDQWVADMNA